MKTIYNRALARAFGLAYTPPATKRTPPAKARA